MKKSLLALAVLGAFASAASAQSSVTLFGIVDVSARQVKNDGNEARRTMANDGLASNRLGFRGVEDLGGGLRAGFHLEGAMTPDDGTAAGQQWRRRSYVALIGRFGEVRFGREYTPSFWNTTIFDPFGTNGVGSSLNVTHNVGQTTYVRSNNSFNYFLPAMGGLYGQVMLALGEGNAGKYTGGRIGFKAGPVDIAVSTGSQDTDVAGNTKFKHTSVAGSYKVGPATLMAQWNNEKTDGAAEDKETRILLGAAIAMGQGNLKVAYTKTDEKDAANRDATQIALGYDYNLSPRTALYGTYSTISNKNNSNSFTISGGAGTPSAGGKSTGLEAGIRHSF
jgi:predicted porin